MRTKEHPSNALYRGEARDFTHAMRLVAAMCDVERNVCDGEDCGEKFNGSLDAMKATALRLAGEHALAVRTAELEFFEKCARSADEDTRRIGEAGLAGDYSTLAI